MADQRPEQVNPDDENKKDTVRINLPPGLSARPAAPPTASPSTVKLKPATQEISAEEEAKKETAVMGRPAAAPKPKSDTARVQVAGKPAPAEVPRPTVKLKATEAPPPAAPAAPPPASASMAPVGVSIDAGPSGLDAALAVGSMLVSIGATVFLYLVVKG